MMADPHQLDAGTAAAEGTPPAGPTSGNRIENNQVLNNVKDCGITLASHYLSFTGSAPAVSGGVYGNTISHNTPNGNGATRGAGVRISGRSR